MHTCENKLFTQRVVKKCSQGFWNSLLQTHQCTYQLQGIWKGHIKNIVYITSAHGAYTPDFWWCMCAFSLLSLCSVVSDSLQLPAQKPAELLCPWNFPGKHTGVGCQFLLQGIFPTQWSNLHLLCLLHWQGNSLQLCQLGRFNNFDL